MWTSKHTGSFRSRSILPIPSLTHPFLCFFFFLACFADYEKYGWDIISNINYTKGISQLLVADGSVIKHITATRNLKVFQEDAEAYKIIDVFGPNLISAEGKLWARQRKVASPAFNEENIQLVWYAYIV